MIRLHDARHTCGSLMAKRGVPVHIVSAWLGHAKASFTHDTYIHAQPQDLISAGEVFRQVLKPDVTEK